MIYGGEMKNEWLFRIICWVFSLAFLVFFFLHWGFPPNIPLLLPEWIYLAIGLLFLVLPFFTKIKIADFIELERIIKETQKELHEQQQYANLMFARLNANVTAVATSVQNVHVHLGPSLDNTEPPSSIPEEEKGQLNLNEYMSDRVAFSFVEEDTEESINPRELDWESKAKELFWLGQNLMYVKAVLLSGGPINQLLFTLRQAYLHMKNLGLDKSDSIKIIIGLMIKIQGISSGRIDVNSRENMARAIQSAIYRIGNLCSKYQELHTNG